MSKDSFRAFVRSNPNFIYSVRNKRVTWQELYELYDLYGEDKSVFNKYLESSSNNSSSSRGSSKSAFNDISNMIKELDVDKVQNGVTSLQKALSLFSELFASKEGASNNGGNNYEPRAVYKRFED